LYTCLFATKGHDLRPLLRSGEPDEVLVERIRSLWEGRDDRYSELRSGATDGLPKVEMSYIGG
jgi:cyclic pyranopterin phosphate synthase